MPLNYSTTPQSELPATIHSSQSMGVAVKHSHISLVALLVVSNITSSIRLVSVSIPGRTRVLSKIPWLHLRKAPCLLDCNPKSTMSSLRLAMKKSIEEFVDERYTPNAKKQKTTSTTRAQHTTQQRGHGPHLTKLLKVYKGVDDWHLPIFRNVAKFMKSQEPTSYSSLTVLYPGSSRHITASLVFSNVTYVDTDTKVNDFFHDAQVLEWVDRHKEYEEDPTIRIQQKNFESAQILGISHHKSFDLLISASAGIVSTPCAKYLKPGGYFLVSDAHFDARQVYLDHDQFRLVAAIDHNDGTIQEDFDGHFVTTQGRPITPAQVEESKTKPKARRSFQLQKEGLFYLFQKK